MTNQSPTESDLDAIIAHYLESLERGDSPDRDELIRRHPELADDLQDFFDDHDQVNMAAKPLQLEVVVIDTVDFANSQHDSKTVPKKIRYFGDYELVHVIAHGGMGVVYCEIQSSLNRQVALKKVLRGAIASDKELARFRAEAEAAAQLDHPNIVPIYEVGEHDGLQYFTMKLIDGDPLSKLPTADVK